MAPGRQKFEVNRSSRYEDVCQAVTELAEERKAPISADEFPTLNRCLDNAIADAVTSFDDSRQNRVDGHADIAIAAQGVLGRTSALQHHRYTSLFAIRSGNVGLNGATGNLLMQTLGQMQSLADRNLPQIHQIAETTTMASR